MATFDLENIRELLQEIDQLKAEIDALRPLDTETEQRVMQKFRLDWNFHSNAIEGNSLTYGETKSFLMHGLTAKGKPFKDHLDIKGHNEAINFLMDFVKAKRDFTEKDIRDLHSMVLQESYEVDAVSPEGLPVKKKIKLGEYKTSPNHVRTATGEIHQYASPEDTPILMAELIDWFRENTDVVPVVRAAIFHHRFTEIHPFDDGNGRMARILMNLILMREGYPPTIIKQDKEDRAAYYNALARADAGEPEDFLEFVGLALKRSLALFLKGAKGESIEEKSDFQKRLVLLTEKLKGETTTTPQLDTEISNSLVESLIIPLHKNLMLASKNFEHVFSRVALDSNISFEADKGKLFDMKIEEEESQKERIIGNQISDVKYELRLIDFKNLNQPFSTSMDIVIHLAPLGFEIRIGEAKINTLPYTNTNIQGSEILNQVLATFIEGVEVKIKNEISRLKTVE